MERNVFRKSNGVVAAGSLVERGSIAGTGGYRGHCREAIKEIPAKILDRMAGYTLLDARRGLRVFSRMCYEGRTSAKGRVLRKSG